MPIDMCIGMCCYSTRSKKSVNHVCRLLALLFTANMAIPVTPTLAATTAEIAVLPAITHVHAHSYAHACAYC